MLAKADVFIQNLAPGATDRLGLDSESLLKSYPRLITCDISGYGEHGQYQDMKAYDLLIQSESGLVSVSGGPESYGRIGVSICDVGAGMNALSGVLLAIQKRHLTGKGSSVLEVVKAFENSTGQKLNYKIVERRAGDITAAYADTTIANKELKWKTEKSLDEALLSAWKWQEQQN